MYYQSQWLRQLILIVLYRTPRKINTDTINLRVSMVVG